MFGIPPAILIGLLLNMALSLTGVVQAQLPIWVTGLRDILLVLFFICVGLSLVIGKVQAVITPVLWVLAATAVLIIGQNCAGIGIAHLYGEPLQTGVLLGSVSFVGGLGSAVAWGGVLEGQGVPSATSIGLAGAMLGTVVGALVAGPFGTLLAGSRGRCQSSAQLDKTSHRDPEAEPAHGLELRAPLGTILCNALIASLALASAVAVGTLLQELFVYLQVTLPRFLTGMIASVALTLCAPEAVKKRWRPVTERLEPWLLNSFLIITFTTLDLKAMVGFGSQLLTTGCIQIAFSLFVSWALVFVPLNHWKNPLLSRETRRLEAAATAAAVIGFGLSSLSVAMAVLRRMSAALQPLPQARQTIAVTGAGLVDLLNALVIGSMLWLVR